MAILKINLKDTLFFLVCGTAIIVDYKENGSLLWMGISFTVMFSFIFFMKKRFKARDDEHLDEMLKWLGKDLGDNYPAPFESVEAAIEAMHAATTIAQKAGVETRYNQQVRNGELVPSPAEEKTFRAAGADQIVSF